MTCRGALIGCGFLAEDHMDARAGIGGTEIAAARGLGVTFAIGSLRAGEAVVPPPRQGINQPAPR